MQDCTYTKIVVHAMQMAAVGPGSVARSFQNERTKHMAVISTGISSASYKLAFVSI